MFVAVYNTSVSCNSTPRAGDILELHCVPGNDGRPDTNLVYTWIKDGIHIRVDTLKYFFENEGKVTIKVSLP